MVLESAQQMPNHGGAMRGMLGAFGGVFNGSATTGTLGTRIGLAEDVETSLDFSAYHFSGSKSVDVSPSVSRWAGAGRAGVSWGAVSTGYFRPLLGFGGGYSAGGGFVSPDLGFVSAYENRYFVPLLQARGGLSIPLGPKSIVAKDEDGTTVGRPELTCLVLVTVGGEVPLSGATYAPAIGFGFNYVRLIDRHDDLQWWGLSMGLEVPLWDE